MFAFGHFGDVALSVGFAVVGKGGLASSLLLLGGGSHRFAAGIPDR